MARLTANPTLTTRPPGFLLSDFALDAYPPGRTLGANGRTITWTRYRVVRAANQMLWHA